MQMKTRAVAVAASLTLAGIAAGAAIASAASGASTPAPALQKGPYVLSCWPARFVSADKASKPIPATLLRLRSQAAW